MMRNYNFVMLIGVKSGSDMRFLSHYANQALLWNILGGKNSVLTASVVQMRTFNFIGAQKPVFCLCRRPLSRSPAPHRGKVPCSGAPSAADSSVNGDIDYWRISMMATTGPV